MEEEQSASVFSSSYTFVDLAESGVGSVPGVDLGFGWRGEFSCTAATAEAPTPTVEDGGGVSYSQEH